MGRKGNYQNRVLLTDNTQWAEINDSWKMACVVPHYHPPSLCCFKWISLRVYSLPFQGQLENQKQKLSPSSTFLFISDSSIIRDIFDSIPDLFQSKCISLDHRHHMLWCLNTSHALQRSEGSLHIISVLQSAFLYFHFLSSDADASSQPHTELTLEQLNGTIYRNFQWRQKPTLRFHNEGRVCVLGGVTRESSCMPPTVYCNTLPHGHNKTSHTDRDANEKHFARGKKKKQTRQGNNALRKKTKHSRVMLYLL